jgi:plasmid stabilization system protein ParE
MKLQWTTKGLSDLARLHEFLAPANPTAAAKIVQSLAAAPTKLLSNPRLGERLQEFNPREVRRIVVSQYEIRYEIDATSIYILRIWHTREER